MPQHVPTTPAQKALPAPHRAPLWLRGLIMFVVLWLAIRIVGNITESLRGMAGHPVPPTTGQTVPRG